MNSIKRKHGLTNSEIAELVNNLSDDNFYEVFLELAEINNIDIDNFPQRLKSILGENQ